MASDGIACRILIQVNTFPYLGSLVAEDGGCATEYRARLGRGQAIGASLRGMWDRSQRTDFGEYGTYEGGGVACGRVRLWGLDARDEWGDASWGL